MNMKSKIALRQKLRDNALKLRFEAKELSNEIKADINDFIVSAMEKFVVAMSDSWKRGKYIDGSYSDDFTKFVHRNYIQYSWKGGRGITAKHTDAIVDFNTAWENLNKTFVDGLLSLTPDERREVTEGWGLKNLDKLEI